MTWTIEFARQAAKARDRLPQKIRDRILHALEDLARDPFGTKQVKALQGRPGYRLRVGEYRVVYRLEKDRLVILVIDIATRQDAY